MKKKRKKATILEDYIKEQKRLNREIELERNGGHWIAIDRPHANKKKYNRKREKVRIDDYFSLSVKNISIKT